MWSIARNSSLIITSILLITGCTNSNNKAVVSKIDIATVMMMPTNSIYTFQSTLEAKDNVRLAAQVVGRIRSIDAQEGGQVKKGNSFIL